MNKTNNSEKTTSGQSEINTAKTSSNTTSEANEKMNRENLYHWGATREIMDIIRKRNKSPETRRLVERREALAKPGTMRRRYDTQSQRLIFTPSQPNKRSREEIAEIDAELTQRAHRIGGGYRPLQPEEEEEPEAPEEGELQTEQNTVDNEEDSVIMRGDNLPIVDLSKYHTDGKEAHYIQINHIVGKISENKKLTEGNIKKAEFNFMLDLKTLISKTAIDPEMTRVRASMRREEKDTAPEGYRPVFDKLSIRWGLVFVDDQFAVPIDLRRKLIEILHFGHSGTTKMLSDAKIFWWPEMRKDIEQKVKDCTACLATAPNRPKIPIYVGRDADGEITNHMWMARTKTEERQLAAETKSPKKKRSSSEKRHRRESAPAVSAEITPKNRYCLQGIDGKYGKWDEILRDILNGKLRIVQNEKHTETVSEDEDDDDDDEEEMPEEAGKTYDTSERGGRYAPIQTDPENDAIQIHTDGEMPQGQIWNRTKRHATTNTGRCAKAARLLAKQHDITHHILKPLKNLRERRGIGIRFTRQSSRN